MEAELFTPEMVVELEVARWRQITELNRLARWLLRFPLLFADMIATINEDLSKLEGLDGHGID